LLIATRDMARRQARSLESSTFFHSPSSDLSTRLSSRQRAVCIIALSNVKISGLTIAQMVLRARIRKAARNTGRNCEQVCCDFSVVMISIQPILVDFTAKRRIFYLADLSRVRWDLWVAWKLKSDTFITNRVASRKSSTTQIRSSTKVGILGKLRTRHGRRMPSQGLPLVA
jgi:hypothetical protein